MSLLALAADAGQRVEDSSLLIAAPIAAAAGVVSFLSPCVLPLVPAYLSFVTGQSARELAARDAPAAPPSWHRVALGCLGFVLGVSVVFVSFGAAFGGFGRALREHSEGLTQIFGGLTILLGLVLGGALSRVALVNREVRIHRLPKAGVLAAPVLGITFALGWTPCIGPTLGAVLGLAASSEQATAWRGATLAFAYCLGLGIPLLVAGLAFDRATRAFAVVKRHYRLVVTASGAMLVVLGVLQVTGVWSEWMQQLQTSFGGADLPL